MATMATEMLATWEVAIVTVMAVMTSVMGAVITATVEGTAGDGAGEKGVVAAVDGAFSLIRGS